MEWMYLGMVVFLFLLATFDLFVGVSNDAVNFLNSAIGSRAARFRTLVVIASAGVFLGCVLSNGMMDIARHGIFSPQYFSFHDVMLIYLAVMVTDIVLLDAFNSFGMPTSTTVSMVFELLGASFAFVLLKMATDGLPLGLGDYMNTSKALEVILGIFLSVPIAFVFGAIVQFLARLLFSFRITEGLRWKAGLFGGAALTAIIYFMLFKGLKNLSFMDAGVKEYLHEQIGFVLLCVFIGATVMMQVLHALKVNVFRVVVLCGTFALATAFAGNDLVNFIGVPLTGLSSYMDYSANGAGDYNGFLMSSLNGPSNTSLWFLIGAGVIMVVSLATSKKAQKVSQTEVGLGSQAGGDEMFGSSRIARTLVRKTVAVAEAVERITPPKVRRWFNKRFNADETIMENGAAFDLIRGSVNLVLAGALIALGTSLKLPLSTTFVTFMVAMGTSLADRAWGRESAVFRITGVMSVIGGWFLTAGVAFIGAGILVLAMHFGGHWVMLLLACATIAIIIRSNRRFSKKNKEEKADTAFHDILATTDKSKVWPLFLSYINSNQQRFLIFAQQNFLAVTESFRKESLSGLNRAERDLREAKKLLKADRRKETLCLRHLPRPLAIEKSTWFYLGNNCCMSMLYNLRRIAEVCKEHTQSNLNPLPEEYADDFDLICTEVSILLNDTIDLLNAFDPSGADYIRSHCEQLKYRISDTYHRLYASIRDDSPSAMSVLYVYLNMLQETRELIASNRSFLRSAAKLRDNNYTGHPAENAPLAVAPV